MPVRILWIQSPRPGRAVRRQSSGVAFPDVVEVGQVFWGRIEDIARATIEEQVIRQAQPVPEVAEVANAKGTVQRHGRSSRA